ncbi:MAG: hypothetical protein JOZ51_28245 [Chloroflexi bacterium]|nr:hypothetical protein [Chloroflexota bacterium]
MLAMLPTAAASRTAYLQELEATIAQAAAIGRLTQLPWPLLALNATFYLDQYLTRAAYRAALNTARHSAAAHQSWQPSPGTAADANELHELIRSHTPRPQLYRWLFERALSTGNPAQFLLAQHAVEIAEVVSEQQLEAALHLGLIALPTNALDAVEPSADGIAPGAEVIEQLSRALLRHRLTTRHFAESLLLLHAARRAQQLTGVAFAAPIALHHASAPALDLPSTLNRLRIVQRHDLAQRAVTSGDPLAIITVEAGLVEAEELNGGPQLLLLSALDRATRG